MKKINILFIVLLLVLGACKSGPTDPIIPPESITITTVSFLEIMTTATTADIKSSVNTNGAVNISIEYGIGNYTNTTNTIPSSFSVSTNIGTKLTNLIPNTRYQFRVKAVTGTKSITKYIADSTFVTKSQLQIGDSYNDGVIDSLDASGKHGSVIKQFPRSNWETAMKGNGQWILVSIDKLKKIYTNRALLNLTTIPGDLCFWSSTPPPGPDGLAWAQIIDFATGPLAGFISVGYKTDIHNVVMYSLF